MFTYRITILSILFCLSFYFMGCGSKDESPPSNKPAQTKPASTSNNSVLAAPVTYIETVIHTGETTKGKLELITFQKAIEAFQLEEGRNPASMDELVQKLYIKTIPQPPAGQTFSYDAEKGVVKLVPKE